MKRYKNYLIVRSVLLLFTLTMVIGPAMETEAKTTLPTAMPGESCWMIGDCFVAKTTFSPKVKNKKVTWQSSKKKVATVDKNGRIVAKRPGKTTITAKYKNQKCKYKIEVIPVHTHQMDSSYYTVGNLSYRAGFAGQCTWYGYGRFYERTGIALHYAPNAKLWLEVNQNDARVKIYKGKKKIRENAIAIRTKGEFGHVMYIEYLTKNVDGNPEYVYFTECNVDNNGRYDAGVDCLLKKYSYKEFLRRCQPAGYIVSK